MAVADDERRSDPSGRQTAHDVRDGGHRGDGGTTDQPVRPNIDRIADKVKGILRPRH